MKSLLLSLSLLLPATAAEPTISAGIIQSFAIDHKGTAFGWGYQTDRKFLLSPSGDYSKKPVKIMSGIKAISTGEATTLMLDDKGNVYDTGEKIGTGGRFRTFISPRLLFTGVKAISAGANQSFIIKKDGSAWACQSNTFPGHISIGPPSERITSTKIMNDVQAVAVGDYHSLFLKKDGSVWAMGLNMAGQLGDGTYIDQTTPVHVLDDVKAIATGYDHSLFLKTDGTVLATIAGSFWFGTPREHLVNKPVPVMTGVKAITVGTSDSFLIKTDDSLWVTGINRYGELGDGTTARRTTPRRVMKNVAEVAAGPEHTIVKKKDGTIWTSGHNSWGQLGDGTLTDRTTFVQVTQFKKTTNPEIIIRQPGGTALTNGRTRKNVGTTPVGVKGAPRTFTIGNTGDSPLTGLKITTDGPHARDFLITQPAATVKPGKTTTFTVTFKPAKTGTRTATLHIRSNDQNESPFDIKLTGLGTAK